jgi:asparagine synthase (glutamine-hydrolysing)
MCGIAGILDKSSNTEVISSLVTDMCNSIKHRGPDGDGRYVADHLVMGMRRLSIIDIDGAKQPFKTEDGNVIALYNGEIYNYIELKEDLKKLGYQFKTDGDGEVIPYLYEQYGIDFISHLRGMFAISLLDKVSNKLYLIRDRMGEKPIYYYHSDKINAFYYASEIKALLKVLPEREFSINTDSIDLYLKYQFVPEPQTLFNEIIKVPAAHYLEVNIPDNNYQVCKYWDLSLAGNSSINKNSSDAIEKNLIDIMSIIGRSDVPVGIMLSGGIDSSAVATIFTSINNAHLNKAFTVGYQENPPTDERKFARSLAKDLEIPFQEVEISTSEFVRDLPELVRHMDDPVADIAAYSIFRVMKAASKDGLKVILNGIGADEIFWGYPWTSQAVRQTLKQIKEGEDSHLYFYEHNADFNFAKYLAKKLYTRKFKNGLTQENEKRFYKLKGKKNIQIQMINVLCQTWLFSDPVALGDRLSMANSIELRSPFLDHKLVELAISINNEQARLFEEEPKKKLKDALRKYLPASILDREKKGFTPPTKKWLAAVFTQYQDILHDGYLVRSGLISKFTLKTTILITFLSKKYSTRYSTFMYKLILLELWLAGNIDGSKT